MAIGLDIQKIARQAWVLKQGLSGHRHKWWASGVPPCSRKLNPQRFCLPVPRPPQFSIKNTNHKQNKIKKSRSYVFLLLEGLNLLSLISGKRCLCWRKQISMFGLLLKTLKSKDDVYILVYNSKKAKWLETITIYPVHVSIGSLCRKNSTSSLIKWSTHFKKWVRGISLKSCINIVCQLSVRQ